MGNARPGMSCFSYLVDECDKITEALGGNQNANIIYTEIVKVPDGHEHRETCTHDAVTKKIR